MHVIDHVRHAATPVSHRGRLSARWLSMPRAVLRTMTGIGCRAGLFWRHSDKEVTALLAAAEKPSESSKRQTLELAIPSAAYISVARVIRAGSSVAGIACAPRTLVRCDDPSKAFRSGGQPRSSLAPLTRPEGGNPLTVRASFGVFLI